MRWDGVFLAGLGVELPPAVSTEEAVAQGLLTPARRDGLGFEAVRVSTDRAAPELAVGAAKSAVARSGFQPEEFGVAIHSSVWFQGRLLWPVASYIAHEAVGPGVPAFQMEQQCNATLSGIEIAAAYLKSGVTDGTAALLTAGERFVEPMIDRWNSSQLFLYGDAAAAAVVSTRSGFARVVASVTTADNFLEATARGTSPLSELPPPSDEPYNQTAVYREFASAHDENESLMRLINVVLGARDGLLKEAGVDLADIRRVVISAVGASSDPPFYRYLDFTDEQTTWQFSRHVGHLGPADQFAALTNLVETGGVAPGDLVLVFGGGTGYTCTAVLLEILDTPQWDVTE